MLKIIEIKGLRGFATTQSIRFAYAGQGLGSGLTILVGANIAGKSTVIEAIRDLTIAQQYQQNPSFTQGRRNRKAGVLKDLGFTRVVGILDGNRNSLVPALSAKFPNFHFFAIPADDVRTKTERVIKPVTGLLDDENKKIRTDYEDTTRKVFIKANEYLAALPAS